MLGIPQKAGRTLSLLLSLKERQPTRTQLPVSVVKVYNYRSDGTTEEGTAFFLSADGYLLTCQHVVAGFERVLVKWDESTKSIPVSVVSQLSDSTLDYSVLKLAVPSGYMPLICELGSEWRHHDQIVGRGYPFGSVGSSDAGGILVGYDRNIGSHPLFSIEDAINIVEGMSGAPVWNARTRRVVAMIHAKRSVARTAYAIPIADITKALMGNQTIGGNYPSLELAFASMDVAELKDRHGVILCMLFLVNMLLSIWAALLMLVTGFDAATLMTLLSTAGLGVLVGSLMKKRRQLTETTPSGAGSGPK